MYGSNIRVDEGKGRRASSQNLLKAKETEVERKHFWQLFFMPLKCFFFSRGKKNPSKPVRKERMKPSILFWCLLTSTKIPKIKDMLSLRKS